MNQGDVVTRFEAAPADVKVNCVIWSNSSQSVIVAAEVGNFSIYKIKYKESEHSIINSLLYNVCSMKNVLIKLEYFYDFLLNQGSE